MADNDKGAAPSQLSGALRNSLIDELSAVTEAHRGRDDPESAEQLRQKKVAILEKYEHGLDDASLILSEMAVGFTSIRSTTKNVRADCAIFSSATNRGPSPRSRLDDIRAGPGAPGAGPVEPPLAGG